MPSPTLISISFLLTDPDRQIRSPAMSSNVRPEFGPTLPEILGPKWRPLARVWKALILVAVGLLVALVAVLLFKPGASLRTLQVSEPIALNLTYDSQALTQRVASGSEVVRLETPAGAANAATFAVSPITVAPYRGSIQGQLPLTAFTLTEQMAREDRSFRLRAEGPVRIHDSLGYQILYQFARDGKTSYGRRLLLFPGTPGARSGYDIQMTQARSSRTPSSEAVSDTAPLREPYRAVVNSLP